MLNHRKFTIPILIAIIITLILTLLVRENQHNESIIEYLKTEISKEEVRLETYREFVKNYNELYSQYNELYLKYEQYYIYWQEFTITAYTQHDDGCNNITAIGLDLNDNWTEYFNFVAVDPDIIPYGKTVFIKLDGKIIEALAVDCGYKIKGNRLDFYCNSLKEAFEIGIREDVLVGIIR